MNPMTAKPAGKSSQLPLQFGGRPPTYLPSHERRVPSLERRLEKVCDLPRIADGIRRLDVRVGFPAEVPATRQWWVVGSLKVERVLVVQSESDAIGFVRGASESEMTEAREAWGTPYRWTDLSRIVCIDQKTPQTNTATAASEAAGRS